MSDKPTERLEDIEARLQDYALQRLPYDLKALVVKHGSCPLSVLGIFRSRGIHEARTFARLGRLDES